MSRADRPPHRRGAPGRRGSDPRSAARRGSVLGFLVGAAVTVPAVFFALLLPVGEFLQPFLTPGAELLRRLPLPTASWPGAVTLALASLANGVVVGAVAAGVAAVVARRRRRHQPEGR